MVDNNVTVAFVKYIRTLIECGYSVSFFWKDIKYGVHIEAINGIEESVTLFGKTFFELEQKMQHYIDSELGGLE